MALLTQIRVAALLLLFAPLLLAEADNTEPEKVSIPELPKKEKADAQLAPENEGAVVKFEESMSNPGLFSDTGSNTGYPRYFSAIELSGYLRTRATYFRNASLGTYIPSLGLGTSNFPPNLSLLNDNTGKNPAQNNFSGNMRLRLDPTINISELMRIRSTIDLLDNLVLGSTPSYMHGNGLTPPTSVSMMALSQNPPISGVNSLAGAIAVKRAWGEANFPFGELRFGRMPYSWGLGILYNSGDSISSDYGDQIDAIMFTSRIVEHYISLGYSFGYTGGVARGGGHFASASNFSSAHLNYESGQRYPVDSDDFTHVFLLSFLKRDSDFISNMKRNEGRSIFNYGILTSFRHQYLDSQNIDISGNDKERLVIREGNVGLASLWAAFSYKGFHLEGEFAGIWGKYQIGEKNTDLLARNDDNSTISKRDVWLLQGGLALKSHYGFLNDRLQVGLDGGWASSEEGPGFGIREWSRLNPAAGNADGRKLPAEGSLKTNFSFNPAYTVDLLLYREVLGTVASSVYVKPHISYFFSKNLGLRADLITSFAPDASNTPGNSSLLGVEADASAFLKTDSGFYTSLAYGILFPLKGLNHDRGNLPTLSAQDFTTFGTAKIAQTVQLYLGLTF
jgi:uncharacterized protein (TIGR04551 family)